MARQETEFRQTGPISDLLSLHYPSMSCSNRQWKRKYDQLLDCDVVGRSVHPKPQRPTLFFASSASIPENAKIPATAKKSVFLFGLCLAWTFSG